MRSRKAALNSAMILLEEIVTIICSLILPRLILIVFGSRYNGLTASISQFLTFTVLLRAGIGGATRAALYKPLALQDRDKISSIVKATDIYLRKIGMILAALIVVFSAVYPFLVRNEFEWLFTFFLFLIIGITSFANSYFGMTYYLVLQADQELWILSLLRTICNIGGVVIAAVLILNGATIHLVKLGSAVVFLVNPLFISAYVKKKYHIDKNVEPDNRAIAQRWDAFWQSVAEFVMERTDVMVLTVFTNMLEVSVYSVYDMIVRGLRKLLYAFSSDLEAVFGNMIAKNEEEALRNNISMMETVIFGLCTVLFISAILLVQGFVSVYTKGIYDVNYIRPEFALVFFIAQFFNGVRVPYQMVVQAAGHYKQTKKGAIVEPIINLSLSCILVIRFGLVGIAVGTLAAMVFRTIQYSYYMSKYIVKRSQLITAFRIIVAFAEGIAICVAVNALNLTTPTSYSAWFVNSVITGTIAVIVVAVLSAVLFKKDSIAFVEKIKKIINRW